jgi:hydrogenase expression/formation protein HypE
MSFDLTSAGCPLPARETERVLIAHGGGGRLTSELIERLILPAFSNPALDPLEDQALLPLGDGARLAFTTDSYLVTPLFFPGGDIGELAVNGTINDLAMGGARPLALSLALILEEGWPLDDLRRVLASIARAANRVKVPVVTGDTKVVGRGHGDGLFINTSGVGLVPPNRLLGAHRIQPGDAILVSGTLGDHGVTILAQREGLALGGDLRSDTAPLLELTEALLSACPEVHALRDPTRGGLGTILCEVAERRGLGVVLQERSIPVREEVRGACELFGLDPLLIANEGKLVAFVPQEAAEAALVALRRSSLGRDAALIGRVTAEHPGSVEVETDFGGTRRLDLPLTEPLPRIC